MSFLNIMVPVETLESLRGDVLAQVNAERLQPDAMEDVYNPTPELERLATVF
jgi:hypothetical protein